MNLMDYKNGGSIANMNLNKYTIVGVPNSNSSGSLPVITHTISSGTSMIGIRNTMVLWTSRSYVFYDLPKIGVASNISTWNAANASYFVYPTLPNPGNNSMLASSDPLTLYMKATPGQTLYLRTTGAGESVIVYEYSY